MTDKISTPYLQDILDSIDYILLYTTTSKITKVQFETDTKTQDAVIRRLELIGEATKRLEKGFRSQYEQIPWQKMAGLRDVLIHEYDEIDLDQLWIVINEDLPILRTQIVSLLSTRS